ncbi:transcription elongation factor spt4 [Ascochyta clinopodiicola]|nr:transcription elongation factor spt4 [Ascochyta clinopodiicola]
MPSRTSRRGFATAKKVEKYIYLNTDSEEISPPTSSVKGIRCTKRSSPFQSKSTYAKQSHRRSWCLAESDEENIDPANPRGLPKLSSVSNRGPPSQRSDQLQQSILANALFPPDEAPAADITILPPSPLHCSNTAIEDLLRKPISLDEPHAQVEQEAASRVQTAKLPTHIERSNSDHLTLYHLQTLSSDPPIFEFPTNMANMISGGAFVPPNQQRNLRACMVCSVVRTQAQFLSGGCPNCEDILELIGNPENVTDCTSAVFEGLITVADTSKSWVARYQRLEGYVPGVYATQVEGILPEEMVSAIEAAGINYVPRDGSEDQMIPKD